MRYVTDTHAFVWYLQDNPRLSTRVHGLFTRVDRGIDAVIVPTIVLAEMVYLAEKKRIDKELVETAMSLLRGGSTNYLISHLDLAIIDAFRQVPRSLVPELPDRVIAATGLTFNLPVLSRDRAISAFSEIEVIWE